MIRVHFTVKEKRGSGDEILGKISSIGLHFIEQYRDVVKGVVRLTTLKDDKFGRLKNEQLVITADGLGIIKDCTKKFDADGKEIKPLGINVRVRNLNRNKIFYNLKNLKVVDIINNETGLRYPAIESDYPYLLIDDAVVDFIIDKKKKARLSLSSRRQYADLKTFTKKVNGIQLLNLLIKKGIWNPKKQ
jgi:hypothetical protein